MMLKKKDIYSYSATFFAQNYFDTKYKEPESEI